MYVYDLLAKKSPRAVALNFTATVQVSFEAIPDRYLVDLLIRRRLDRRP